MNTTATTPTVQDEPDVAAATKRLDQALDCLCTLFAWVDPQPSVLIAEQADEEDIDTAGMCKAAATMYDAAGTLELLMMRILRCKQMEPLLD